MNTRLGNWEGKHKQLLRKIYKIAEHADDSNGEIGGLMRDVQDQLLGALKSSPPPAKWLDDWFALMAEDPWGMWNEQAVVEVAGPALQQQQIGGHDLPSQIGRPSTHHKAARGEDAETGEQSRKVKRNDAGEPRGIVGFPNAARAVCKLRGIDMHEHEAAEHEKQIHRERMPFKKKERGFQDRHQFIEPAVRDEDRHRRDAAQASESSEFAGGPVRHLRG